jgi:hypothetical protein
MFLVKEFSYSNIGKYKHRRSCVLFIFIYDLNFRFPLLAQYEDKAGPQEKTLS